MGSKQIPFIMFLALMGFIGCTDVPPPVDNVSSANGRLKNLTIERFSTSPLTALTRFSTETPSRVRITVVGQDGENLTKVFDEYASDHEIPILGLYPNFRNIIYMGLESRDGSIEVDSFQVVTEPLPSIFRDFRVSTIRSESSTLAPGFVLLLLSKEFGGTREEGMFLAVDNFGKVRWAYTGDHWFLGKVTGNGTMVIQLSSDLTLLRKSYNRVVQPVLSLMGWNSIFKYFYWGVADTHTPEVMQRLKESPVFSIPAKISRWLPAAMGNHNVLQEIDFLGRKGRTWKAEGHSIHHDFIFLPNGNLLALASTLTSDEDLIVEVGRESGEIERVIDFKDILDVHRPQLPRHVHAPDWLHANALYYDERDSTIVISARNQSAIVKVTLDSLKVRWILGSHEKWNAPFSKYLLKPVGMGFGWQWGQHAPILSPNDPNRMLVYDNGNQRSYEAPMSLESSYSRAVEYEINETAGTIKQTWEFGKEFGNDLYAPIVGNAEYLSNGNRLICFGALPRDLRGGVVEWIELGPDSIAFKNKSVKSSARIFETTGDVPAKPLLELVIKDDDRTNFVGYLVYRAHKVSFY